MTTLQPYKILSDTMCQRVSNILKVIPHTIIDNPEWEAFNKANPPLPYISNDKVSVGEVVMGEVTEQYYNFNKGIWFPKEDARPYYGANMGYHSREAVKLHPIAKEGKELICECDTMADRSECQNWDNNMCMIFGTATIQPTPATPPLADTGKGVGESNALIAEFMGAAAIKVEKFGGGLTKRFIFPDGTEVWESHLCYHSSWDELMPVVEKIESLGYEFEIKVDIAFISPKGESETPYMGWDGKSKIDATYNCAVQFIQWYNNDQQIS